LPFDVTERGVNEYFEKVGEVVHVKLLKFEDSQRCKGQGIITFDTDVGARAALKLNGECWVEEESGVGVGGGKKKKKKEEKKEGKELRLKVSKVLNRFVTKKQKKG
jgi:RNA recognition motif-containing protein